MWRDCSGKISLYEEGRAMNRRPVRQAADLAALLEWIQSQRGLFTDRIPQAGEDIFEQRAETVHLSRARIIGDPDENGD